MVDWILITAQTPGCISHIHCGCVLWSFCFVKRRKKEIPSLKFPFLNDDNAQNFLLFSNDSYTFIVDFWCHNLQEESKLKVLNSSLFFHTSVHTFCTQWKLWKKILCRMIWSGLLCLSVWHNIILRFEKKKLPFLVCSFTHWKCH